MLKIAVLAVGLFGILLTAQGKVPRKNFLDDIIINVLEDLRGGLVNVTLPDVAFAVNQSGLIMNLTATDLSHVNLDGFRVDQVSTHIVPLKLDNLSLSWEVLELDALYTLDGYLDIDLLQDIVHLIGNGAASLKLENLFVTIASDFAPSGGHLQIPPDGLHGFYVSMDSSNVTIAGFMDNPELSDIFSVFFSFFVREFVKDFSQPIFEFLKPNITDMLNEKLANITFPLLAV